MEPIQRTTCLGTLWILFLLAFSACGVKGPPLPPVADTPQSSDYLHPTSTPTPKKSPSR